MADTWESHGKTNMICLLAEILTKIITNQISKNTYAVPCYQLLPGTS